MGIFGRTTKRAGDMANGVIGNVAQVLHTMEDALGDVRIDTIEAAQRVQPYIDNMLNMSPNQMASYAKQNANEIKYYLGNTTLRQMGSDASNAVKNGPVGRGAGWVRNKSGSLLGDADNFLHNADGSYNRYKVGGAIGAGLGIAGIIGYNANN